MKHYLKHLIPNVLLFPVLVMLAIFFLRTPASYQNLKKLSFNKMFRWQWFMLDYILEQIHRVRSGKKGDL